MRLCTLTNKQTNKTPCQFGDYGLRAFWPDYKFITDQTVCAHTEKQRILSNVHLPSLWSFEKSVFHSYHIRFLPEILNTNELEMPKRK